MTGRDGASRVPESIGERLRRLRRERGFSQRDLSSPGVSYAYISRIEAGTRQPSVKALRKLAQKLGVSADYLETGSEISPADRRELELATAELDLRLGQNAAEAEAAIQRIFEEARAAGDMRIRARAATALGLAAAEQGRYTEAIDLLGTVVGDSAVPHERPDVITALARAYSAAGEGWRAVELLERALEQVERDAPEDVPTQIRFVTTLSHALVDLGDAQRARDVLRNALRREKDGDAYTRIRLYWSLARVAQLEGDLGRALDHARRAIALLETTEDTVQLARAHLLFAWLLIKNDGAEEAGEHLDEAERLLGPNADAIDLAYLRTEQAKRARALGDAEEAVTRARESLAILGESDPAEQGHAWGVLGAALALTGETPAAVEAFRRAVERLEAEAQWQDAAKICREWGRMLRDAGRETEALDVLDRAAALAARAPAPPVRSGAGVEKL